MFYTARGDIVLVVLCGCGKDSSRRVFSSKHLWDVLCFWLELGWGESHEFSRTF